MSYLDEELAKLTSDLKEVIELMLQLDEDKNYSLSDIERDKYAKILKRLE